jgi:hypothetical protein
MAIVYSWVENDPFYIDGYVDCRLASGVSLGGIERRRTAIFSKKYEYHVKFNLKYMKNGQLYVVGSTSPFATLEEAKEWADTMIKQVFGD